MNKFIKYNIDFDNFPTLYLNEKYNGRSYIDFIKFDEVEYPVMKGYDIHNRPFIVIKMKIEDKILMQTFFKRYTDSDLYMGCGHATGNLIDTSGGMTNNQFILLSNIINKNEPVITSYCNPIKKEYIDKYVYLYDKKKIDAAIYIQYFWRKHRYNPKYKFCEIVQYNNFKDLIN